MSDNPVDPTPIWGINPLQAQAAPRCGAQIPMGFARQHTSEASHGYAAVRRFETMGDVPEELAVAMSPEMFSG
jgi:hypothetical protein